MIVIVDTGVANKYSVKNALDYLKIPNMISANLSDLTKADKLIFPGVGAFNAGMQSISTKGLLKPLTKLVLDDKIPVLGICLGFQMFASRSAEQGNNIGLGWIPSTIQHLNDITSKNIPHIGFNNVTWEKNSLLFSGLENTPDFYFVHSYYMNAQKKYISATVSYGGDFPAAIEYRNIFGVQFHPEKSKIQGLRLLNNFCTATINA